MCIRDRAKAQEKGVKLLLPVDAACVADFPDPIDAPVEVKIVPVTAIPADMEGCDIGPESMKLFADAVKASKTVVWNGPMGCLLYTSSSGSRNRYTKMTIVNSSNQTVRTDTWSYDSNGHLAGWTNSGNSNGYSNVLRLSSDNNIGAGNPLFDRHCGKFVTDDKITSASIKFQNDEVVEIRQNNQRISYTNQESMGMNSSNNLTRTFATYTDGGNFRYRTLVEYFKYKN